MILESWCLHEYNIFGWGLCPDTEAAAAIGPALPQGLLGWHGMHRHFLWSRWSSYGLYWLGHLVCLEILFQPFEAAREIKLLHRCVHDSVSERPTWAIAHDPGWPVGLAPMTRDLPDWISWWRSHKTGQREIRHFCFLLKDLAHVLALLCLSFLGIWTSPLLDC